MIHDLNCVIEEFDISGVNQNLAYNPKFKWGNEFVGRAVAPHATGTLHIAADNEEILGKLLEVRQGGRCTVQVFGGKTIMYSAGATACTVGEKFIGGGSGYIKSQPGDTTGADRGLGLGRGIITRIIGTQAQGSPVEVLLLG